ncbi:hypothetical protein EYF80_017336 [Liparis tanakae]|uniref:Uncharacterized protein n=1 Tax=Liparis tanakae TaxID=230148 RepID=A0A4Z2I3L7_9TELE|nr:hypothetical protein EYF80_017336 [Liparis tanakae]
MLPGSIESFSGAEGAYCDDEYCATHHQTHREKPREIRAMSAALGETKLSAKTNRDGQREKALRPDGDKEEEKKEEGILRDE